MVLRLALFIGAQDTILSCTYILTHFSVTPFYFRHVLMLALRFGMDPAGRASHHQIGASVTLSYA